MITRIESGIYWLYETSDQSKILILDKNSFAWIGDSLSSCHYFHQNKDTILTSSQYRLYLSQSENLLTNCHHLELHLTNSIWQGYLLPQGVPMNHQNFPILPTTEIITKSVFFPISPGL